MQVEIPSSLRKRTPRWQVVLNWSLPFVLIAVFAWQINKSWPAIRDYHWGDVRWDLAVLAVGLLLINSLMEILIWNKTLSWFTDPLSFMKATPIYIWSSLARYIPGKVASLIARVALALEVKCDVIPVLASSTVELALRIASGLLLLLIALFGSGTTDHASYIVAPLVVIPLVLVCAHPKIMLPVMNWALKKIKQQPITRTLRYRDVLAVFAAIMGRWVVYGLAFALLAFAIVPETAAPHFIVLMCLAAGSWAIGFVLLSPGGLGIAEALQLVILKQLGFPDPLPAVLPVLFRLGTLMAEGGWALAAVFMRRTWAEHARASETEQVPG